MTDFIARFQSWWKAPLSNGVSTTQWILFVGIVLIAAWAWSRVIKQIEPAT